MDTWDDDKNPFALVLEALELRALRVKKFTSNFEWCSLEVEHLGAETGTRLYFTKTALLQSLKRLDLKFCDYARYH